MAKRWMTGTSAPPRPGTGSCHFRPAPRPRFSPRVTLVPGFRRNRHKEADLFGPERRGYLACDVPSGSQLTVGATDAYPEIYPDEWYVELKDQDTRLTRVVAFPVRTMRRLPALLHRAMLPCSSTTSVARPVPGRCACHLYLRQAGKPCIVTAQGNSRIPHHCDLFSIVGDADCSCRGYRLGP